MKNPITKEHLKKLKRRLKLLEEKEIIIKEIKEIKKNLPKGRESPLSFRPTQEERVLILREMLKRKLSLSCFIRMAVLNFIELEGGLKK